MRPDMAKIIVERPRGGGGCKYPRANVRNLAQHNFIDAPTREAHKSRHFKNTKWLNENLQPLRRFLRSNLGRPWHLVHAEIAAQVPRNSTINYHVWQHLQWDVSIDVYFVDGIPYKMSNYWGPRPIHGFYVDPTDGILREARRDSKRARRLQRIANQSVPEVFEVSNFLEYHCINGTWYVITFSRLPPPHVIVWDVLKRREFIQRSDIPNISGRYASHKRQLGKRALKALIAPRLRQFLIDRKAAVTQLARLLKPAPGRFHFFCPAWRLKYPLICGSMLTADTLTDPLPL